MAVFRQKSPKWVYGLGMVRVFRPLTGLQRLAALGGVLVAVACATTVPKPTPPRPPGAAVSVPIAPPRYNTGDPKFDAFLDSMRTTALARGIRPEVFDSAVAGLRPIPSITASNANQPEFTRPIWSYLDSAVSARRIADAKFLMLRYGDLLDRIAAQSGVPKEILVAVWGMESDYGAARGDYNLFAALATLAYDGPRMSYAQPEFLAALQIYQERRYPVSEMTASWAGAFGQTQFTPTTFLKYASDGDGDGQIDLWRSAPDALASAATLLAQQGWKRGQPWGYEVRLPSNFTYQDADLDVRRPLADWRAWGVLTADGTALPDLGDTGAIYLPAGARGPAFLALDNFSVLLKYNNAGSYALAVGLLADQMMGAGPVKHAWPRDERPLSRDERFRFQANLAKAGFDPGAPDGVMGRRTRAALRQYQQSKGIVADGFATAAMLAMLDVDTINR
jgi:membrane-bound lytic murein transglycosylase B